MNPAVMEMLLEQGADIESLDNAENTPFLAAVESNDNVHVIELLVDKGADEGAVNANGESAYDLIRNNFSRCPALTVTLVMGEKAMIIPCSNVRGSALHRSIYEDNRSLWDRLFS